MRLNTETLFFVRTSWQISLVSVYHSAEKLFKKSYDFFITNLWTFRGIVYFNSTKTLSLFLDLLCPSRTLTDSGKHYKHLMCFNSGKYFIVIAPGTTCKYQNFVLYQSKLQYGNKLNEETTMYFSWLWYHQLYIRKFSKIHPFCAWYSYILYIKADHQWLENELKIENLWISST